MISLVGLNKADVLAALYNASHPQGLGFLHYRPESMNRATAETLLAEHPNQDRIYFDYLMGRVMKVDLSGDSLDPSLYDRDNGQGAAEKAIFSLRK